jgi:Transglycosylase SLT domain
MLGTPAVGVAAEPTATTPTTTTVPAPTTPSSAPSPAPAPAPAAPQTPSTTTETTTPATPGASPAGGGAGTPQVQGQHAQGATPPSGRGHHGATGHRHAQARGGPGATGRSEPTGGTSVGPRAAHRAPAPFGTNPQLALPPSLALTAPVTGVASFYINSFRIPPFLLPIYQAAGNAYRIPWQVLAAINEVETNYGYDLSVSSAGAEGWMQFLPSSWQSFGVDANGDGFVDPYNPADAIFAAARYLAAAGGERNIRAAIFAYNHSWAYVDSVMLRAQLLGGTPPTLLGALTGLSAARFPVHAPAHFSDGFQTVPASEHGRTKTLVGTTIYTQPGAPVIATQDGRIVGLERLTGPGGVGRFVALRDTHGDTYIYAQLGDVATRYPVLKPHRHGAGARGTARGGPSPAFRAGAADVYLRPLRVGAHVLAGTILGHVGEGAGGPAPSVAGPSSAGTGPAGTANGPAPSVTGPSPAGTANAPAPSVAGPSPVGTANGPAPSVAGSSPAGTANAPAPGLAGPPPASAGQSAHMLFQIRPPGAGAPLIDPKPILDSWVELENASVFNLKGEVRKLLEPHKSRRAHRAARPYPPRAGKATSVPLGALAALAPEEWVALIARLGKIPNPQVARGRSAASIPDATPLAGGAPSNGAPPNGGETGGHR